jgi:hypothetical protein
LNEYDNTANENENVMGNTLNYMNNDEMGDQYNDYNNEMERKSVVDPSRYSDNNYNYNDNYTEKNSQVGYNNDNNNNNNNNNNNKINVDAYENKNSKNNNNNNTYQDDGQNETKKKTNIFITDYMINNNSKDNLSFHDLIIPNAKTAKIVNNEFYKKKIKNKNKFLYIL